MHRDPLFKRIAALVLLFVLVAAEAMTIAHALDFDAHAGGEPCKICVSAAGLGSAAPARVLAADVPHTDPPVAVALDRSVPAPRPERASARGPPLAS